MENNSAILEGLNSEQKKAVECVEGPVLIVAGAGSGKTKVLTCRIARILEEGGDPARILALTFTRKAAGEMKERIALMVGGMKARRLCMGTFHSVFIRFLRDYAEFLGYPRDFTIYDTSDSVSAIKSCVRELGLDDKIYKPKEILSRISMAKNSLITAESYAGSAQFRQEDSRTKRPRLGEVYTLYARRCRQAGVMDFDDILVNMNILLRDSREALEEISGRFDYIMVDEYQDTNYSQYLIIKKLSRKSRNICVVGDDSQSIYAFRGARIENILSFRKDYPDCRTFRLEQNYRSTQVIVDAANSLIAKNTGRIPKECFSKGERGEKIRLVKSYSEQDEALAIVDAITTRIMKESAEYQDFAVLYRTNAQSRAIEEAMRRRNMPYMIYSGNSFYDRAEVKDMMAYFKLAVNRNDDESFRRVVNRPARGIGDTTVAALSAAAHAMGCSLMQAATEGDLGAFGLKSGAVDRVRKFASMMAGFSLKAAGEDAHSAAVAMAVDSGLYLFYKSDLSVDGQSKAGNVEELLNSVKAFVEERNNSDYEDMKAEGKISDDVEITQVVLPPVTLADYLENVSLLSAVDMDQGEEAANRVALMTVHSAKGLEFPYVIVAGMEENLFPSGGWLATPDQIEEERRLFYVAITRAKKAVWLTFAVQRMRNGKHENNPPSRFIGEIDSRYVDNPLVVDGERNAGISGRVIYSLAGRDSDRDSDRHFGTGSDRGNYRDSDRHFGMGSDKGNYRDSDRRNAGSRPQSSGSPGHTIGGVPGHTIGGVPGRTIGGMPARLSTGNFSPDPVSRLRVGQRVEHSKFGPGVIRNITSDLRATVDFDTFGTKTLLLQYAKLRVLED